MPAEKFFELKNEIDMLLSMSKSTIASLLIHTEDLNDGISLRQEHVSNLLWQVERNLETIQGHANLWARENWELKQQMEQQSTGRAPQ